YLPLGQQGTRSCKVQLLTLPAAVELTAVEQSLSQSELAATISQIGSDKDQYYLGLIAHNDSFAQAEELLRQAGASRVSFGELSGTPSEELARCQGEIQALEQQIVQTEATFAMLAQQGDLLKQVFDGVQTRIHCLRAEQKLLHTEKTCLLAGWIPVRSKPQLEKLLAGYTCYYQFVEPQKDEETPVLLKNNKLVEPFECVTEMYSLPSSNGIDPDPFMAPFFFLFFGMMLSDAGYGLLLLVGGLIGAKLMGGNKLMKMLGYCGISTIVWGLIYGSFFGDMLTQVARVFFHVEFALPALIDPLKDPITILVLSFAFGALHLFVGMGLKAYLMVRRGHAWAALFDVGSWYFVLIGLVMLLAGGIFGKIGMYMAIGGAVMLILTQGRDKKNIFMKAASGVLSLYDITGYFSDILSYSRIMALGLATGVIGSVVNTMGTMPGGSFFGFLVYLAVFLFGHTLNFAINALGSYVHTSRLQYVEFFGKFYEGGGAGFAPLTANTKYVNIKIQEEK
ncbi:MAG: V-type ATP synthase subunit I, partial [Angelakisella sp.]